MPRHTLPVLLLIAALAGVGCARSPAAEGAASDAAPRDVATAPAAATAAAKPDPAKGTLLLALSGRFPLRPAMSLMEGPETSLHQACLRLRQALAAPERRLVLDCSCGFEPSLAAAEEMAAILRGRDAGRTVACLIDGADDAAMVVAAACDEVVVPEAGLLLVDGIELSQDYYADALAKLGVKFDAVTSGPHKCAPEPFTRNAPSEAGAAELRELADGLDAVLIGASTRGALDAAKIAAARAQAPQPGALAVTLGLADRAVEPGAWLAAQPEPTRWLDGGGDKPDLASFAGMMRFWSQLLEGEPVKPRHERVVAVVELEGEIVDDAVSQPGSTIAGADTADLIDDLADEDRVVAVVVRVNSGGGSASASDRIHHAIERLDAKKPVIALYDDVAASGGYYLGCAARRIIAHRGTITGSIGVFALQPDLSGTRDLLGIHRHVVTTGPRADLMSTNALTADKTAALRQIVDDTDVRFQGLVAAKRHLAAPKVKDLSGGRVFTGEQALAAGLVDALGTLPDAVAAARAAAGVEEKLPLETYPKRSGLAQRFALFGAHAAEGLVLAPAWRVAARVATTRRPLVMAWSGFAPAR